jgi:hypothetical protein
MKDPFRVRMALEFPGGPPSVRTAEQPVAASPGAAVCGTLIGFAQPPEANPEFYLP